MTKYPYSSQSNRFDLFYYLLSISVEKYDLRFVVSLIDGYNLSRVHLTK